MDIGIWLKILILIYSPKFNKQQQFTAQYLYWYIPSSSPNWPGAPQANRVAWGKCGEIKWKDDKKETFQKDIGVPVKAEE